MNAARKLRNHRREQRWAQKVRALSNLTQALALALALRVDSGAVLGKPVHGCAVVAALFSLV